MNPALVRRLRADAATLLLDADGRPVAEVGSPRYAEVHTDEPPCTYPDARLGMPINASALRQVGAAWPSLLRAARHLAGPAPTVAAAWRGAIGGIAAPVVHDQLHPGAPIPRVVSAGYKIGLGMSQVLGSLLLADDGVADAPLGSLGTPAEFFGFLDEGRWLLGARQACAGTRAMFEQLFVALCDPAPVDAPAEHAGFPDGWHDLAVEVVALQLAALGAAFDDARAGVPGPAPSPDVPPWLRPAFGRPDRRAAHARRLFVRGGVPDAIEHAILGGRTAIQARLDLLFT